jgi:feruloyl-CoA synthase
LSVLNEGGVLGAVSPVDAFRLTATCAYVLEESVPSVSTGFPLAFQVADAPSLLALSVTDSGVVAALAGAPGHPGRGVAAGSRPLCRKVKGDRAGCRGLGRVPGGAGTAPDRSMALVATGARRYNMPMALFAKPDITVDANAADGTLLLRSAEPLRGYPVSVVHSVREWARADPGHPMVAERGPGASAPGDAASGAAGWRTVSYGEAMRAADGIGEALVGLGLSADRPLMILSGNSVDHMLLTLGAMTAGIPVAPGSVAYSLQSRDHQRIKDVRELITPGAVYAEDAEDAESFGPALDALDAAGPESLPVIISRGERPGALRARDLAATVPGAAVRDAFAALTGDHLAKILFTSGSTGAPKGVLNPHRMLSSNQQMIRQAWPFLREERPVICDWLPWSHTFGGNHNMNMTLVNGGTLYIDGGRPAPGLFGVSAANLADVRPTIYFNVPVGYAQLIPALEAGPEFAWAFFSRLRLLFNAAAALPAALRERLEALAATYAPDRELPVTGSWGTTETGPAVLSAHYPFSDARCVGVPLPGAEVKLIPAEGDAYEVRVKGPNVTPGYFARPDLTAAAFDDEGFYRSGDAMAPADAGDPDAGLIFRGRTAEDFKLETGTFVRVGAVRTAPLSAMPMLSDAVIVGENRDYVTALAWLNPAETETVAGPAGGGDLVVDDRLRAGLAVALARHNAGVVPSGRIRRLALLAQPASLDAGEVTDKGYVNQRKVLARLVELLYRDPVPPGVIVAAGE